MSQSIGDLPHALDEAGELEERLSGKCLGGVP